MHLIKAFLAALVVVVMSNANAQPSDESFSDFAIAKFDLAIGGAQTITTREGNDTFNAQNIYDIEVSLVQVRRLNTLDLNSNLVLMDFLPPLI